MGPNDKIYLSIVIPLYNEEESVKKLVVKIFEVTEKFSFSYEVLLIDDGSTDKTWQIIEQLKPKFPNLKAIKFRRNYGQTNAMVAGFDYSKGEVIVTMDGDLQNDPLDIPRLLEKINEGYDIVSGWRRCRKDHLFRIIPSKIANALISRSTGVHLHDYGCSLKAYRSECIKAIKAYGEMHRFFPALGSMTGARVTELPVNHHARKYGVSKYGFDRILKVLSDIFAVNLIIRFSSMPLKGFSICSLPFLFLAFLFSILAIFALIYNWTSGKALIFFIAAALSGMGFIHLVSLGVLGELIVGTSDLSHTQMPEITKKIICIADELEEEPILSRVI